MLQGFRLPKGLDYIKLPCLNRGISGEITAKYLGIDADETVALRAQLIYSAAVHFKPDLLLVDKKPTGLRNELTPTLDYLQQHLSNSRSVLLLRDILDAPEKTSGEWQRLGYYQAIQAHYDQVLVVGMQSVFDLAQAYQLPLPIARKMHYCGYIRKQPNDQNRDDIRRSLKVSQRDHLTLVTPGGGEDGYTLIKTYLEGLKTLPRQEPGDRTQSGQGQLHSLVLCGPEMPAFQQVQLRQMAAICPQVTVMNFTDNLLAHIAASDTVVSMGGYNTLTEILSLDKRAVVVPRVRPSQEQLIRATQFAQQGLITMIHPDEMTPRSLMQSVLAHLDHSTVSDVTMSQLKATVSTGQAQPSPIPPNPNPPRPTRPVRNQSAKLDFSGLPRIANQLSVLLPPTSKPSCPLASRRMSLEMSVSAC